MPPPSRADLWKAGKDETVEVNQRALIDKILARYSGEHTIFRELLQNADDAGAQHVQVKFYTQQGFAAHEAGAPPPDLPDAKRSLMTRYVVCNDGIPFRPEDWNRLKKIAEGNPDEEKIGAFGVGFYSLWSVCDDPFVESGNKWMGFYWKDGKDQLLARSGDLPPGQAGSQAERSTTGHPWTTFTMALREPAPLEAPLDFARFLVTSITFMRTIKQIDMIVDDTKVLSVRKDIKGQNSVTRPGLNTTSSMGMMKVQGVDATSMLITARVMKWLSATGVVAAPLPPPTLLSKPTGLFASFFGRSAASTPAPVPTPSPTPPTDPTEVDVLAREIQVYQADIKVSITSQFGRELERATKKAPPTRMPASLVFSREDETATAVDGSAVAETKRAAAVFAGLCPPLDSEKSAKVFIGQPTSQTTGIGGHLAARFIPTVERESIDLVDRHVAHWNKELLWVGGYLARMIYELELAALATQWQKTTVKDTTARAQILARGLHALKFFSFRPTTPSAAVGAEMESAFFQSSKNNNNLAIISTSGILPVDKVRMPNDRLQEFVPDLPVVTANTISGASRAVGRLRERGLLHEVKFEDVVEQLGARPLTEKEMIACLSWWQAIAAMDGYSAHVRNKLLDAAILVTNDSKIVPLNAVKTFVNPQSSSIPPDMPLPPDTIPYSVTKEMRAPQMNQTFGWHELTLAHYVEYLIYPPMSAVAGANPETDIRASPIFAERVLGILGRAWQSISGLQQSAITQSLKDVPCIPTRAGFKKPGEAYFEKNLLFADLPTIAFPKTTVIKGGLEKMLLAIGVRRTVDLQLVFSRLVGGGEWSCLDLMKYLVSVKDTLSTEELARLKHTAAFPLLQPPSHAGEKSAIVRKKPHELYEPIDTLRELGLPVLDWGENKWRPSSDEAKMLHMLGLRRSPPIDTLLGIAAGKEPSGEKALAYLLSNMSTQYSSFDPASYASIPFIPATTATGNPTLAKPGEVFTNDACKILGFAVARPPASLPENASKLRIQSDPPMDRLVSAFLHAPESDTQRATKIFEYLATRVGTAQVSTLEPLTVNHWIPVQDGEKGRVRLARPDEVYFKTGDEGRSIYANAFTFIDFGERANFFLRQCGVKSEPSHKDIARLLLREPQRMLKQAGSPSKYRDQLRLLAANMSTFDSTLMRAMKDTPFVLASTLVEKEKGGATVQEWILCRASETAIIDHSTAHQYFGKWILAAPEESLLEKFYEALGAKKLSSKVAVENLPMGIRPGSSRQSKDLQKHILERLTIFMSQHAISRKDSSYSIDFLTRGDNFVVREAADIKTRYTYRDDRNVQQHMETLYACAERSRSKAITLTVSMTADVDWYDVAHSLSNILLTSPRIDDALVLESILNTPLMSLRKRGYNVDRILNQQREERLRVEAESETTRRAAAEEKAREAKLGQPVAAAGRSTASPAGALEGAAPPPYGEQNKFWNQTQGSIMDMVRNRITSKRPTTSSPTDGVKAIEGADSSPQSSGGHNHVHGPGTQGSKTTKRPTSLSDIRNTVLKAVNASRPENQSQFQNSRRSVADVSESQGQYCDDSAEANLFLAWKPEPWNITACKIWLSHGHTALSSDQLDIAHRFSREILVPLANVFNFSSEVLNVFYDDDGPLIAFNRSGAIFCNARYYTAWHDEAVQRGQRKDAFISWYFTLAHELAHNLESAHNASHEFYFSSISEEFLVAFTTLLQ